VVGTKEPKRDNSRAATLSRAVLATIAVRRMIVQVSEANKT
jgi:hypothetical protein